MVINVQEMIMKKTYIAPNMETVKIQTNGMLATSLPTGTTPTSPSSSDAPEFDFFEE